jgi:predicted AAA+ superfamily ATPase
MDMYLNRTLEGEIHQLVNFFPVVAIVGPRQVGKTSLVKTIRKDLKKASLYLDLENPDDLIKLTNPSLFLDPLVEKTVIIDEVQKMPTLFPVLRGIIDRNRKPGRFILLASASPDLIRDSSETLAGRIAYLELSPFSFQEVQELVDFREHWQRGGFPDSLLAPDETLSGLWRRNFISTYLERDLPLLGLGANPILSRKLWQMTAHMSGQLLNMKNLGNSLGLHGKTIKAYLDFLEAAYLVRRLRPYHANLKKRLIKTPKIYLRDTGILHQLLGIPSFVELSGHPIIGASWETYVIEQIASVLPDWAEIFFYRTHDGTEADIVVTRGGIPEILIEIKYSTTPKTNRGFFIAQTDLGTKRNYVICPVETGFPLRNGVQAVSYREIPSIFEDLD